MTVFHKPPDAVATYQTLRLRGSTATSAIRPDLKVPAMIAHREFADGVCGESGSGGLLLCQGKANGRKCGGEDNKSLHG